MEVVKKGWPKRRKLKMVRPHAFRLTCSNIKAQIGQKSIAVGDLFLEHPKRKTFGGTVFCPDPADVPRGFLNEWQGFRTPSRAASATPTS